MKTAGVFLYRLALVVIFASIAYYARLIHSQLHYGITVVPEGEVEAHLTNADEIEQKGPVQVVIVK